MAKYSRRRRSRNSWLGPAHADDCRCAGDHCGQADAARSARRRTRIRPDDTRTYQLARGLGISARSIHRRTD